MGVFFKRRFELVKGKKYLVLSPNFGSKIHAVFPLILFSFVIFKDFYKSLFLDKFLLIFWIFSGIFGLWIIIMLVEYFPIAFARLKNREVLVKGGFTVYHKKQPMEKWIEQ